MNIVAGRLGRCGCWSPGVRGSSARTSSTRCSRAATRCTSSTTSRTASARTCRPSATLHVHDIREPLDGIVARGGRRSDRPPGGAGRRARLGRASPRSTPRSTSSAPSTCSRRRGRSGARVVFASTGGAIYGECEPPGARGRPVPAALALRRRQARGRGLPRRVRPPLRNAARRAPVRQRLRAAPGPARRGGRRRDLPRAPARRAAVHDLRRRQPEPRLRLRGRRRPRHARGAGRRTSDGVLQRRHRRRDVGARAVRRLPLGRGVGR